MRTLLVQPPIHLSDLYGELAKAGSELAPQGLCSIATIARKNGYDVTILDAQALKLSVDETIRKIVELQPDVVGFTLYTTFIPVVSHISIQLKELYGRNGKNLVVLVGGSHATITREKVLEEHPSFDVACIGEGELTFIEILEALQNGKRLKEVNGIVFREEDGQIKTTEKRSFISNLDSIPIPDWSLLPELKKFYRPAGDSIKRSPSAGIVTSRGCDGKCYFCNPWQLGKQVRYHSAEYIYRMIVDLIGNYGIRDIYIQDDTFVINRDNVMQFCKILIEEKLDITWACHGRVNHIDRYLLRAMKRAGCWQIALGIESGSQKVLDSINKGTTVEQNYEALELCREAGMDVKGLFMIGCFGENHATVKETIDFIKKVHITDFHMNFFTPLPLTTAMRLWPKYGNFDPSKGSFMGSIPSFIPFGLTEEELIYYHKYVYRLFYLRPNVIFGYLLKLLNFRNSKKIIVSAISFLRYVFKK